MAVQFTNIVRGSSYAKHYSFSDSRELTGYQLKLQLRSKSTEALVNSIDRLVTDVIDNNTKFVVKLSPDDLDIEQGDYVLGVEIFNTVTEESKEVLTYIRIIKQWVY